MGRIKEGMIALYKDKRKRMRAYAFAGMFCNIAWSTVKFFVGILTNAYFFAVSGVHTLLIGIIKSLFFRNYSKADAAREVCVSRTIGALILASGLAFALYSARLFFVEETNSYGEILAIAIAAFSFGELGISIIGFVKSRKNDDLMLSALKGGKIASGFYALVLTQTAILAAQGAKGVSKYNALSGVIFGICALIVGVGVIIYTYTADGLRRAVADNVKKNNDEGEGRL